MFGKKQSIAEGALVLTLSIAIVKVVGLIYKFPLISRLSGGGWGYYTTAYTIYGVIYSVTGFPAAVSSLVADANAQGRYRDCVKIKQVSVRLFAGIGLVGTLLLLLSARWLSTSVMENPNCFLAVLAVAPSLFFSCVASAYRGYYQGMSDMVPTALSDVVEVLVKALFGYGAVVLLNRGLTYEFDTFGTVLGVPQTAATETSAILSVSAAGAIAGVSVSTMVSWLFMKAVYRRVGPAIDMDLIDASPAPMSARTIISSIIRFGIPLVLSSVTLRITGLIDNATVIRCLNDVIQSDLGTLYASHNGLFNEIDVEVADLANYLYEVYGYAIPFFDLIPTLSSTFATSAFPHITAAAAQNDTETINKNLQTTLSVTMLVAAPAGMGLAFMSLPILNLMYPSMPVGAKLAAPMLTVLGVASIFSCITASVNTMLQGIGKIHAPVVLMGVGCVIKILVNYFLVSVPAFNIKAAPAGNLCCFAATAVIGLILLVHYTGVKFNLLRTFLLPVICGLGTGFSARVVSGWMMPVFGNRISAVVGIGVAVLVYVLLVLLLRVVSREELETIPLVRRAVPTLVKLHLLK